MSDKLQRYQPGTLTRLERLKEAVRSYWQGPITSSDPRLRDFFGGQSTSTGVPVDEFSAMNYSAVYAAVNLIASQVGNLPLVLYKKLPGGGKERYESHPLYRLVHDRPNPDMSSLVWRESSQGHVLTWGNLYTEIQRNGAGRPVALWPITPDRVSPFRRGSDAPLEYRVVNRDGQDTFIPAADMIHVPGLGWDGIVGYSVISKMRESIGLGLAAERFGGTFFGNGASFGGVISYKGPRPPELSDKNYRESLNSQHQGVDRAHKFLALYNDATYSRLGIPPNDAQFLETRQFQVDEIARWFNLPPHKLKELMRSTNNNIEHQNLEYYIDCLSPWLERWEQELCEKLISPLERNQQEIEFVADGLLRGDVASRGDFHSKQFNIGGLTPNDVRQIENRNPLAGGNDAFVALNLIPLKLAVPYYEAQIESIKAKAVADLRPPPEPIAPPAAGNRDDAAIALLTEARDTARRCAQEAEDAKDVIAAELATVRSELAYTVAERDTIISARAADSVEHQQRIESLSLDVTVAQRDGQTASTRADEAQREVERLTAQATALGADLGKATADLTAAVERCALIEADYQRVCQEKTELGTLHEEVDAQRSALAAECASRQGRIDVLMGDVQAAQRDTAAALALAAESDRARAQALELAEANKTARDQSRAGADLLAASVAELEQKAEALTESLRMVEGDRERDQVTASGRIASLETARQRLAEANANAEEGHRTATAALQEQLTAMRAEGEATLAEALEWRDRAQALEQARKTDRAEFEAGVQQATEARTHADEVNQATVAELRNQIDAVTQELAAKTTALLEARTSIGTLEATRAIDRATVSTHETALTTQAEALTAVRVRLNETQQAIRGTVVDAANRLIAKETERARKAQGTPDKLAKWVETFYPIHEDFCRVALKPAVRALLIAHGIDTPVDQMLDRIVLAHVSESSRQLQGVLMDTDIESLPAALERVLRRWEAERAEALADRILKEVA